MTYQIIITEEVANVAVTSESYPIIIEYNATNISDTNTYGNANVAAYLASGTNTSIIDNIGNIITTGSMAAAGIVIATGNVIGGNIGTAGQVTATGNITGSYFLGNGSQLTGLPATYSNANVTTLLAAFGSNAISTTGNVTAGYVVGNGSLLTNLTGANVTGTVANATYALNSNAATFATQATFAGTANAVAGANVSGTVANATYALNSNAATFAGTVTTAAQPNITSVGILTAINTSGNVSATGNITGNYFLGNGSQLTDLPVQPGTYGNANVADFLGNGFGSNTITTTGNITTGNLLTGGLISATGNITGGNIRSAVFQAVNSAGGVLRNATGSSQLQWGSGGGDNLSLDVSTNINGANAQINISPTGNSGHVHIKPTGTPSVEIAPTFTGSINNMIIGNVTPAAVSATTVSATGNITGANLVATANLTSTQQTVVGTANVGTTGNIVVSGRNIATDMKWSPDGATGTAAYTGRVLMGTGWLGNNAVGLSSRLTSMDTIDRSNTATQVRQIESETIVNLTANVSNTTFRQQAIGGRIRIGGGSAGNVTALTSAFGAPFSLASGQFNLDIGNVSPYFLGNTSIGHATLNGGVLTLNGGSSVGNAYGFVASVASGGSGGTSNVTNYLGYSSSFLGANVTGNLFCFYNGNATSQTTYGVTTANTARQATNYYFLRNDDDVAQAKLGSLRTYHEFESATATSGSFAIDKATAQVHNIVPTANCTITGYSNMVTSASDGTNTDSQVDTLTIIVEQGATPYTITLPTGAAYKYAGNVSTVGATANAVTMISVTAANVSGTVTYLTTVSPEFV